MKRSTADDPIDIRPLSVKGDEIDEMRRRIEADFPAARGASHLVLVYPGGGLLPIRAWPLASFRKLVEALTERRFMVGVIGLAEDRPLAASIREGAARESIIDFTGYTRTVRELMILFHLADLLVTNDGGPGHFAAMTPIRTIVLYGPETPHLYGTPGSGVRQLLLEPFVLSLSHGLQPSEFPLRRGQSVPEANSARGRARTGSLHARSRVRRISSFAK